MTDNDVRPNIRTATDLEWAMWCHRNPGAIETHMMDTCPVCQGVDF